VAVFTVAVTFMAALRARVLYRNDHSILGMDFVMIMTASSVTILHSVSPGRGIYYDPYHVYHYRYDNDTASDSSDVILAVQRALAQLGYYHGPVDGLVGPQTERAIRWFHSADSLPVTGAIRFRHAKSATNWVMAEPVTSP
jgi:peptidoglycan hydrolase-like protein with peptidoglycan-binding domain